MFVPEDVLLIFSTTLSFAGTLAVTHTAACLAIAWLDFSGAWREYALDRERKASWADYVRGFRSFFANLVVVFVPVVAAVVYVRRDAILLSPDAAWVSALKLVAGYIAGKLWAFAAHYVLHMKRFYHLHKAHHPSAASLVASHAWLDSWAEYVIMEIPSFALPMLLLPTNFYAHLLFFTWHGIGAAGDHSGFKAPGWLGALFDGTVGLPRPLVCRRSRCHSASPRRPHRLVRARG